LTRGDPWNEVAARGHRHGRRDGRPLPAGREESAAHGAGGAGKFRDFVDFLGQFWEISRIVLLFFSNNHIIRDFISNFTGNNGKSMGNPMGF